MRYRVWDTPYLLSDEEDYIDVTADTEKEAREFARTLGYVTFIELV